MWDELQAANPSPLWELGSVFLRVAAVPSIEPGALRECWLHPWVSWWPHLGFLAVTSRKEIIVPRHRAGAGVVSIPRRSLVQGWVAALLWQLD